MRGECRARQEVLRTCAHNARSLHVFLFMASRAFVYFILHEQKKIKIKKKFINLHQRFSNESRLADMSSIQISCLRTRSQILFFSHIVHTSKCCVLYVDAIRVPNTTKCRTQKKIISYSVYLVSNLSP